MPPRGSSTRSNIAAAIAVTSVGVLVWKACKRTELTRTQYLVMLAGLTLALGLVSDPRVGAITEAFDTAAAVASVSSAMDTIAGIPLSMKAIIMDGLDNMAAAMQQQQSSTKNKEPAKPKKKGDGEDGDGGDADEGGESKDTVQMSASLYEDDASLARKIGERGVDDAKYRAMAAAYADIHYLLCNLKAADRDTYDAVLGIVLPKKLRSKLTVKKKESAAESERET